MFSRSHGTLAGCGALLAGPVWDLFPRSSGMAWPSNHLSIATDVTESEEALTYSVDVPGIDPKELKVSIEPGRLEIRGTRIHHHRKSSSQRREEWVGGAFLRTFSLPSGLNLEKAGASAKNGVLNVTIPKTEATRSRRIPVNGIQPTPTLSSGDRVKIRETVEGWLDKGKSFVTGLFAKKFHPLKQGA